MKYSNNPEDWKVTCAYCNDMICYDKKNSYVQVVYKQQTEGKLPKCKKCTIELRNKTGPAAKYSFDSSEWVLKCIKCDGDVIYKNRSSYCQAIKKVEKGASIQCRACAATGYKHTDEAKDKMKNREYTDEDREKYRRGTIRRYENMTDEERRLNKLKMKEVNKRTWDEMDEDVRVNRNDAFQERVKNLSPEKQTERYDKIRVKCLDRMVENGGLYNFKPSYNKSTIPYIIDILNVRYGTEFIHAESDDGEFKIYDAAHNRFYYADAYCPLLNIWVEFDEKHHDRQFYIDDDRFREDRIRSLLDCQVLRIPFDKHIHTN